MKTIDAIKQLDNGYHLSDEELDSIESILNGYLREIKRRKDSYKRIELTDDGTEIDGILIDESIQQEDKYDYYVVSVKDEIANLIQRISEGNDNSDLMITDLKQLIDTDNEYMFSSIDHNEYIDNTYGDIYNSHCDAILKLNEE